MYFPINNQNKIFYPLEENVSVLAIKLICRVTET